MLLCMLRYYLIFFLVIFGPVSSAAQTKLDLVDECLKSISEGDREESKVIAEQIIGWRSIFSTKLRLGGRECLEGTFDEGWTYIDQLGRFGTKVEEAALAVAAEDQQKQNRAIQLLSSKLIELRTLYEAVDAKRTSDDIYAACLSKYRSDEIAALTNAICVAAFRENGHPETPPFSSFARQSMELLLDENSEFERTFLSTLTPQQIEIVCTVELKDVCAAVDLIP